MELAVEQGAQALWGDLVAGDVDAFVARAKSLVGKGDFASRASLQNLSKSFFQHAQAGDGRLAGALEMLAAVVREPFGLHAVRQLDGDAPWNAHQLRHTALGAVLDNADICVKRPCETQSNRGINGDGVWCAVAFAYVVVATRGCPAIVRSSMRVDGQGRAQLEEALHMPLEFLRHLAQGQGLPKADTRKPMRQLLHAVWKWWRDRPLPQQGLQPWARIGTKPLTREVTRLRGILLEVIVEGAFAAGFIDPRVPGVVYLVGSAAELRAGLAYAAAAVARDQVTDSDGVTPLEFDAWDWEVCAKACAPARGRGTV